MKKTPDIISKKRQQLAQQIESLQLIIDDLSMSTTFTHEQRQSKTNKINEYSNQLKNFKKELYETRNISKRFNINYGKNLRPGVF
jgi:uncharacterized coiled-coil DUF342 family protein